MAEYFLFFKALHIIGFVSWFAGLFYLVRIFVYHAEASGKEEVYKAEWKSQFSLMEQRAFKIIATPAMVITWVCGLTMISIRPDLLDEEWLQVKLGLIVALTGYHFFMKIIIKKLQNGKEPFSSFQFRLLNELPTLFLVAIVLLAVVKNFINFLMLFFGILAFGVTLYFFAKLYKKQRNGER